MTRIPRIWPLLLAALLLAGCHRAPPQDSAVPASAAATTLILVRHAERADTSRDSPLSETGHVRARALQDALVGSGIDLIVVSQYQRTAETAAPLATALRLRPRVEPLEGETPIAAARLAQRLMVEEAGRTILIVSHSDTVPAMLNALMGSDLPELDRYGDLFILTASPSAQPRVVTARFGDD